MERDVSSFIQTSANNAEKFKLLRSVFLAM